MTRIKKMKTPKRLPKALSREQVAANFQAIPASVPRDRALIGLAYHAGLRVEELVNLRVDDVDLKRGRVTVQRGKGGKGRTVPLNQLVKRSLTAYLKVRPDDETTALFVSRHHRGLSTSSAQKLFKRYAQKAKVNASIHALRHSVATHMLDNGAPLAWIQDFLGHASITSTVLYSKLTDKRREEVFHQLEMSGAFVG